MGSRIAGSTGVLLLRATHPRAALGTACALAAAAALTGRPAREVGLVLATVLVGQALLGWADDLADRVRDRARAAPGEPLARGRLEPGTVWFALTCAALLAVPLAMAAGPRAGGAYLLSLLVAAVGDRLLRRGVLSFLPWVVAFALYPAYLAYGGWGGVGSPTPPPVEMTVLAGLLGLGVHLLRALPGLVADHAAGERSLPLRIALRTGAPRLLLFARLGTLAVLAAMLVVGQATGPI